MMMKDASEIQVDTPPKSVGFRLTSFWTTVVPGCTVYVSLNTVYSSSSTSMEKLVSTSSKGRWNSYQPSDPAYDQRGIHIEMQKTYVMWW
jgi:hypothetical protein